MKEEDFGERWVGFTDDLFIKIVQSLGCEIENATRSDIQRLSLLFDGSLLSLGSSSFFFLFRCVKWMSFILGLFLFFTRSFLLFVALLFIIDTSDYNFWPVISCCSSTTATAATSGGFRSTCSSRGLFGSPSCSNLFSKRLR